MSFIDTLKSRLRENFGGKKKTGTPASSTSAPGGIQLRPDVNSRVSGLSKRLVVGGAAVILVGIFGVWFGLSHVKPTMTVGQSGTKISLASANNIVNAKNYTPPAPAAVASAPKTSAKTDSIPHSERTVAAENAPVNTTQQSPQLQALAQALGNSGQSGGGWGGASPAQGNKTAPVKVAAAQPQFPGNPESGLRTTPTAINPVNGQSGMGVYDTHLVRKPASPYEVMEGSVIPATLTTGIESDLPGEITAVVSRNVFDSASGAHLLIPAGARLLGTYSNKVLPGQGSVAVAWTRVVFPNGSYINLGTMPGTDPDGMSGISGDVDNHTWLMFKNALLVSLVGTGIQAATPQSSGSTLNTAQVFQSQLANTFGQAVSQVLQRYSNIAPTIKVQPGAQVVVVVSKDLVFPGPYTPAMQAAPVAPRDTALAAMVNPYPEVRP